jgi:hypothetical protein
VGCGRQPIKSALSVDEFSHFFTEKVDTYHQSTEGSLDPDNSDIQPGCLFKRFAVVGSNDVIAQSFCNVLPVPVLKQVTAEVAPFLISLDNRSVSTDDMQVYGRSPSSGMGHLATHVLECTYHILSWLQSDSSLTQTRPN